MGLIWRVMSVIWLHADKSHLHDAHTELCGLVLDLVQLQHLIKRQRNNNERIRKVQLPLQSELMFCKSLLQLNVYS